MSEGPYIYYNLFSPGSKHFLEAVHTWDRAGAVTYRGRGSSVRVHRITKFATRE